MLDFEKIKDIALHLKLERAIVEKAFEALWAYETNTTKHWTEDQKQEADLAIQILQKSEKQYGAVEFPLKQNTKHNNPLMEYLSLPYLKDGLSVYTFTTEAYGSGWFSFFPGYQGCVIAISESDTRSYGQECLQAYGMMPDQKSYNLKIEKTDVLKMLAKKDRLLEKNIVKANQVINNKSLYSNRELDLAIESLHICEDDMRCFLRDTPRTHWASVQEASKRILVQGGFKIS